MQIAVKCLAGGLRRICQALILPLNTTLINTEISDGLDKQPEVLWNQETCVNKRLNKSAKAVESSEINRVSKLICVFLIAMLSLDYSERQNKKGGKMKSLFDQYFK